MKLKVKFNWLEFIGFFIIMFLTLFVIDIIETAICKTPLRQIYLDCITSIITATMVTLFNSNFKFKNKK